jgi:hypothetical protein
MWYKEHLNNEIDGMEDLLSLFETTEAFYEHLFKSIKFFKQSIVQESARSLLKKIDENEKIPVRYTMKTKDFFHSPTDSNQRGFNKKNFKNKKDALYFAEIENLVHTKTGIRICIDSDNNTYVKKEIFATTGYKVSSGAGSHMFNYEISHIWGNTENPFFFSSLWNVVLIPKHLSYILDKPDSNNPITRKIKRLVKGACFELYNPNELMKRDLIIVDETLLESTYVFRELIRNKKIVVNFIEAKLK